MLPPMCVCKTHAATRRERCAHEPQHAEQRLSLWCTPHQLHVDKRHLRRALAQHREPRRHEAVTIKRKRQLVLVTRQQARRPRQRNGHLWTRAPQRARVKRCVTAPLTGGTRTAGGRQPRSRARARAVFVCPNLGQCLPSKSCHCVRDCGRADAVKDAPTRRCRAHTTPSKALTQAYPVKLRSPRRRHEVTDVKLGQHARQQGNARRGQQQQYAHAGTATAAGRGQRCAVKLPAECQHALADAPLLPIRSALDSVSGRLERGPRGAQNWPLGRDPGCKLRLVSYVKLTVSYSKIQLGLGKLVTFSARILSLRRVVQPPA